MPYLMPTPVFAYVRTEGSIGAFSGRSFDLMLDQEDTPEQQRKEAIRILHQIGYETRGVRVGGPFNDPESQP